MNFALPEDEETQGTREEDCAREETTRGGEKNKRTTSTEGSRPGRPRRRRRRDASEG